MKRCVRVGESSRVRRSAAGVSTRLPIFLAGRSDEARDPRLPPFS
ncbi:hypothetical protein OH687_26970 [Burkholderia anthina]|nr:hypothetical protein OH687_26970 [Burkholderia anthina]